MNSRSSVNQSSLINFSTDLPSLDAKDSLLSFPFDHLYACHADSSDQREGLQLSKEVDLSTPLVVGEDKSLGLNSNPEVEQLNDRLTASENQNKRLKDLLIYHLDLIQQQNELITKRDKLYQALKLENESLKSKLSRRHGLNLPPPAPVVAPPALAIPPLPPVIPPPLSPVIPPLPSPLAALSPSAPSVQPAASVVQQSAPASLPSPVPALLSPVPASLSSVPVNPPSTTPVVTQPVTATPAPAASATVTSPAAKTEVKNAMLNSFTELFMPEKRSNSYLFDHDLSQASFEKGTFGIARTTSPPDSDAKGASDSSKSKYSNARSEGFKPIQDGKRSLMKKETVKTEPRSEPLYTVTSNSGNPVIQRVQRSRKRSSAGVGHLSRMTRATPKVEAPEASKKVEEPMYDHFGINKKRSMMLNTYGKTRVGVTCTSTSTTSTVVTKCSMFGSLSDRFQLIDKTPTGEDPYQLGEADLREQSPIPKLMLQKNTNGRMKLLDQPTRRIYDPDSPEPRTPRRANRFLSSTFTADLKKEAKTMMIQEPDLSMVKTEPEIDWRAYSPKFKTAIETTCGGSITPLPLDDFTFDDSFSGGEEACVPSMLDTENTVECTDLNHLFVGGATLDLNIDLLNIDSLIASTNEIENLATKTAIEGGNTEEADYTDTLPLLDLNDVQLECPVEEPQLPLALEPAPAPAPAPARQESRRGRRRAHSTTGLAKGGRGGRTTARRRGRGRGEAAARGRRSPPPARTTTTEYHTDIGNPDDSWYFGLDPDITLKDIIRSLENTCAVEVPRWREKPMTSTDTLEGTENVDDKVFEKRHQKLEAEERRQLRWHMRRIREQRHVEKLKQRQRDSWCATASAPTVYTVWPRPQRDVRFIEITDTLPVMAFGEMIPNLTNADFMLPWVRTSKALKRSKRSKTLH